MNRPGIKNPPITSIGLAFHAHLGLIRIVTATRPRQRRAKVIVLRADTAGNGWAAGDRGAEQWDLFRRGFDGFLLAFRFRGGDGLRCR